MAIDEQNMRRINTNVPKREHLIMENSSKFSLNHVQIIWQKNHEFLSYYLSDLKNITVHLSVEFYINSVQLRIGNQNCITNSEGIVL